MLSGLLRESFPDQAVIAGGAPAGTWPTLLVIDSDTAMLGTLACYFEKRGFHVAAATSLAEAKSYFHRRKAWTLVVADYHLPDGNGWELCSWVREQNQATPCLLMSGSANAAALCADADYIAKPFPLVALEERLHTLIGR
jgi:DNA-binding response OmpR family regulator